MPKNIIEKLESEQAELFDTELHLPKLFAKDAMIKPTFFYKDDNIKKILEKLKREDCNVCVVVDSEKNFFGEIEDEDLIRIMAHNALHFPITKILDRCYKRGLLWRHAKDLARKHKNVVSENTPINKVLELVYKKGDQNIIVVNGENKVAGVITSSSLLRLLSEY